MMAYTIEAALKSRMFDRVIVSTENPKIHKIALSFGAEVLKRPSHLAEDTTPTEAVVLHVLDELKKKENYSPEVVSLLQATSPLRDARDIQKAARIFFREKADSLLSVEPYTSLIWRKEGKRFRSITRSHLHRPRRQDISNQFRENGAVFFTRRHLFQKHKNRLCGKISFYVMSQEKSVDVDSRIDLELVKQLLRRKHQG